MEQRFTVSKAAIPKKVSRISDSVMSVPIVSQSLGLWGPELVPKVGPKLVQLSGVFWTSSHMFWDPPCSPKWVSVHPCVSGVPKGRPGVHSLKEMTDSQKSASRSALEGVFTHCPWRTMCKDGRASIARIPQIHMRTLSRGRCLFCFLFLYLRLGDRAAPWQQQPQLD